MVINSATEEIMERIRDAFSRYSIQVTDEGNLYKIRISDDIPYIFKYNSPYCYLQIGNHVVDFNKEDVFNVEIM